MFYLFSNQRPFESIPMKLKRSSFEISGLLGSHPPKTAFASELPVDVNTLGIRGKLRNMFDKVAKVFRELSRRPTGAIIIKGTVPTSRSVHQVEQSTKKMNSKVIERPIVKHSSPNANAFSRKKVQNHLYRKLMREQNRFGFSEMPLKNASYERMEFKNSNLFSLLVQ